MKLYVDYIFLHVFVTIYFVGSKLSSVFDTLRNCQRYSYVSLQGRIIVTSLGLLAT